MSERESYAAASEPESWSSSYFYYQLNPAMTGLHFLAPAAFPFFPPSLHPLQLFSRFQTFSWSYFVCQFSLRRGFAVIFMLSMASTGHWKLKVALLGKPRHVLAEWPTLVSKSSSWMTSCFSKPYISMAVCSRELHAMAAACVAECFRIHQKSSRGISTTEQSAVENPVNSFFHLQDWLNVPALALAATCEPMSPSEHAPSPALPSALWQTSACPQ